MSEEGIPLTNCSMGLTESKLSVLKAMFRESDIDFILRTVIATSRTLRSATNDAMGALVRGGYDVKDFTKLEGKCVASRFITTRIDKEVAVLVVRLMESGEINYSTAALRRFRNTVVLANLEWSEFSRRSTWSQVMGSYYVFDILKGIAKGAGLSPYIKIGNFIASDIREIVSFEDIILDPKRLG